MARSRRLATGRINVSDEGVPASVKLSVAAFGKHPAWADHLDLVEGDEVALRRAEHSLMVDGIESAVNAGGWRRLSESQPDRLLPFAHGWLLSAPGLVLLGRMLESRDGIGRSRYPFVLAARLPAGNARELVTAAASALTRLESACVSASSLEELRALLEAGITLRVKADYIPPEAEDSAVQSMAARLSLLHSAESRREDGPCRFAGSEDVADEAWLLLAAALTLKPASGDLLAIWPDDTGWIDLIKDGVSGSEVFWTRVRDAAEIQTLDRVEPIQRDKWRDIARMILNGCDLSARVGSSRPRGGRVIDWIRTRLSI